MDNFLKQLGIDCISSAPYHPQINGKLEIFHKYLKPTLKKPCENDPDSWDKYINQILASYHVTPHIATAETPFFLFYRRYPNLPLHQLLELMQHFLDDPKSGCLDCESHHLELVVAKKTLDDNRLNMYKRQQTTHHLILKLVTEYTLKWSTWKMGSKMECWLWDCPYRVQKNTTSI